LVDKVAKVWSELADWITEDRTLKPYAYFSLLRKLPEFLELARKLDELGYPLLASGGTAQAFLDADLPVTTVEELTGLADMFGGRVKTLHPGIFGRILATTSDADQEELEQLDWRPIGFVVVDPYDLAGAVERGEADIMKHYDIGGCAALRAGAKNYNHGVTVVRDPKDCLAIISELETDFAVSLETRQRLAFSAMSFCAEYDELFAQAIKNS
jgi:phosphoribosylaminoimidazolecarboxamide formyltransferase/IMP cyclohydrolase